MKRLDQDEDTKLICLVSMLADREIMEEVLCEADQLHQARGGSVPWRG